MTTSFELKVLSPNRTLASVKATSAVLPGTLGYMTILPDHAAMVAELDAGELLVEPQGGAPERFFILGGYVEVDHNRVTVLADAVEKSTEINLTFAEETLKNAQARLTQLTSAGDVEEANKALRAAQIRVQVAKGGLNTIKH